jgi:hypothetical protein
MNELVSLKKNIISYSPESKFQDIETILQDRFENGEFIID